MLVAERKSRQNKGTNDRRHRIKKFLIESLGGKCCCCGYDKYFGSLDFHHVLPETKAFGFAHMISKPLKAMEIEIKKCVLICANCHRELHDGLIELPKDAIRVPDDFTMDYQRKPRKIKNMEPTDSCPECGNAKPQKYKHCSIKCANISSRVCERPTKEELAALVSKHSWVKIGKMFGVSDNAVRKWAKQYELL